MLSLFHQSVKLGLAIATGVLLTQAPVAFAQQGQTRLQPIPESQYVPQHHCPSCQRGNQRHHGHHSYAGQTYYQTADGSQQVYYDGQWSGDPARQGRVSPGTGWCAPGKVPLVRERVEYWKYYPNYWSGYGPGPAMPYRPMVYTPTDTAQMGFYSQHVPSWSAQPWRVPGPPHPAAWHNRYCSRCQQGQGMYPHPISYGHPVIQESPVVEEPTLAPQQKEESKQESSELQPVFPPEPFMPFRAPSISLLPDAPPEV